MMTDSLEKLCICTHSKGAHIFGVRHCINCGCRQFTEKEEMNSIEKLEKKILDLQGQLNEAKELFAIEKKKRVYDFAVTSIPIGMMDSDIRDHTNFEPTRTTWVTGHNDGFRCRVPIRLMTDAHLRNTFNVFVKGNHICYPEMKNEMVRRGLL